MNRLSLANLAAGAGLLTALTLGACATASGNAELTEQQVCLEHFKTDPVERDRCLLTARNRSGSPPDMRPQDLPVRSGQPSG